MRISNPKLVILLALLVGLKVILLITLGPVNAPNSLGYTQYAEAMLSGSEWLFNVDIHSSFWQPLTTFWMIGYLALIVALFVTPMFFVVQACKGWNQFCTGERFVTTLGQTTLFSPTVRIEERGISFRVKDDMLTDMGNLAPLNSNYLMHNVYLINEHLAKKHNLCAVDVLRYAYTHFFNNWRRKPGVMARHTLPYIREKQAFLPFMPTESINQIVTWSGREKLFPLKGQLWRNVKEDLRVDQLAMVVIRGLSRAFSIFISLAFLVGAPIVIVSQARQNTWRVSAYESLSVMVLLYWLAYFSYDLACAMDSLEMRFLMPVEPFSMLIGVTYLAVVGSRLMNTRQVVE